MLSPRDLWLDLHRKDKAILRRVEAGKPVYSSVATTKQKIEARAARLQRLREAKLIARTKTGPILTDLARAAMAAPPLQREKDYTAAERNTITKLFGVVPARTIGERLGRSKAGIQRKIERMREQQAAGL